MSSHSATEFEKLSPFELKDELIEIADEAVKTRAAVMLNAGRGNPNWIATTPREAFLLVGQFALDEARRVWNEPDVGLAGMASSAGIADRLRSFLRRTPDSAGKRLLAETLDYGIERLDFDADKFVWELSDAMNGDNYPVPDRMLVHCERIVSAYLDKELFAGHPPPGKFNLFAVEGGTAAMTYIFDSLIRNKVLHKGDTIAIGTPVFTPYLEIAHLPEYDFKVVRIDQSEMRADGRHSWQYPDSEIDKLLDPKIKAFFVVNPANPGAVAMRGETIDRIVEIVREKRRDLIILTDDVYANFVDGFTSLAAHLPHNTILVYSYSKHFGCTGWRLGVIAMHEDHVVDTLIAKLSAADKRLLNRRYGPLTLHPEKLKFIDRLVADSRAVALNHTAGLSLPQQLQMSLFSLFALLDDDNHYKKRCQEIVRRRLEGLARGLGEPLHEDDLRTAYYITLDIEAWIRHHMPAELMEDINKHLNPLDLVFAMARRGTVLLNGSGFDGPPWSARVSLANLPDEAYPEIGRNLRELVESGIARWKASRAKQENGHD